MYFAADMSKAITYSDKGSGPVVVLLHGFCESKEIWKSFSESLSTSYRVICPDLPGFGESPLDTDIISMEWFAAELHALFKLLQIKEYVFIGHSLGGYVGLALAEKYSIELKGLCLFHSTAYADSEERKTNRDRTYAFVKKYGAELFTQSFIEPLFLLKNRQILKESIIELKNIAKQSSEAGVLATTLAMRDRKDRTLVLAALQCPVLLIGGRNDATIPIEKLEEQAQLSSNIQLSVIGDCGHMGMYEQKEETLKVLSTFLTKCF